MDDLQYEEVLRNFHDALNVLNLVIYGWPSILNDGTYKMSTIKF